MKPALPLIALLGAMSVGACSPSADEQARDAAASVRAAASRAGDRLVDGWVTARVQARYFADDDIKARYIDVTTRDSVVTLKGYVENDDVRRHAVQLAQTTEGVSRVDDRLMIGQSPQQASAETGSADAVGTGGMAEYQQTPDTPAATLDDAMITSLIQAKYFVHAGVKGRHIDVETSDGVVTLRGEVASDDERAAALLMARTTQGVQRVEDALTVNASLLPPDVAAPPAPEAVGTGGIRTEDEMLTTAVTERLTEAQLPGITVIARDGVVLMEGTVRDQAARQRALETVRRTEGVTQVVDRLVVK